MSDHRRTVTRKAFVLPGSVLASLAVLVLIGAIALAWFAIEPLVDGDDSTPSASPSPSATATPSPEPTETPEPTDSPEPTESPEPSPEPTETTPSVDRSAVAVSVLNATRTSGLARAASQQVQGKGWTVGTVGNWRGYVAATTVHYPQGRADEARLLAKDLGIESVVPAQQGMSTERLTLVLAGPLP